MTTLSSYNILGNLASSTQSQVSLQVSVGGDGGEGAKSETVSVINHGKISTKNGESAGIYAQSIGGNGGYGGSAGNLIMNINKNNQAGSTNSTRVALQISVGGSGGTGANAETVTVNNFNDISTIGKSSDGIFAQSIGGGGGDGGSASSLAYGITGTCSFASNYLTSNCKNQDGNNTVSSYNAQVNIGGSGGTAGGSGSVTVNNQAKIITLGSTAYGIFAQSVGGGGGGGGTGGEGENGIEGFTSNAIADDIANYIQFTVFNDFNFITRFNSYGLDIGGSGGAAGNGNEVTITNSNDITTSGKSSQAIRAQSVGGGGGDGGAAVGGAILTISVGGLGSGGGNGGTVAVNNSGALTSQGETASGIFAQSVGGGGGAAGDVELGLGFDWGDLVIGVGVGVRQKAGNGGDGGAVTVNTTGPIITRGDTSHGIFAQSVGGSGGATGQKSGFGPDLLIFGHAGNSGDEGNGGDIKVTVSAPINVAGEYSHGIFAQSVGGPDSKNTGDSFAGDLNIVVNNDIRAIGPNGRGILTQSVGGSGNGSITITVNDGATISTEQDGNETIGFFDGNDNQLINHGTITKQENTALTGYVVRSQNGQMSIVNDGTISGSIFLDSTNSGGSEFIHSFNNKSGGLLESGMELNLGSSSTLVNAGVLSPGGQM